MEGAAPATIGQAKLNNLTYSPWRQEIENKEIEISLKISGELRNLDRTIDGTNNVQKTYLIWR